MAINQQTPCLIRKIFIMQKQIRVLILEDNVSDAELIKRQLHNAGLKFISELVQGRNSFIKALDNFIPDIILADYSLPDFDGLSAMVLARQRLPEIPVIIVSGAIGEETAIEALKSGATDYVLKDRLKRLGAVVNRALQEANQLAEQKKAELMIQDSLRRFELLAQTAGELLESSQPQEIVDSLCQRVMQQLDCNVFFNYLVDQRAGRLHLNAFSGIAEEDARRVEWLDYGAAICGCVARDGCRIVAEHISTTANPRTDLVKSYGVKAYACHPLLGTSGKVAGTLSFGSRSRETFSKEDLSLMKAVADQVAVAMIRVQHEQAVQDSRLEIARTQVLKAERQRLYDVLEALPVYVILLSLDYRVSFSNKFFRERFGEDRGRRCYEYLFNRKEVCENCQTYKVLKTNLPHQWEWRGPDGRDYDIYDFCFRETDGSTYVMEMGIDITDRKLAQEKLLETQRKMEAAKRLSDIGTLAAIVAHELRNPLATINLAASNIKRKAQNVLLDKHLQNISEKVWESDQIINNLLHYSKIKSPHYEDVHINKIIEECAESTRCHLKSQKTISLRKNMNLTKDIFIEADSLQMKELFFNILNNSCDAVSGSEGCIEIFTENNDKSLKISIKDNGVGIDKENLKKVFDPFFTMKAKGTGLGLAVCQQIVNLHGGTIEIQSELNKGTNVYIILPKKKACLH